MVEAGHVGTWRERQSNFNKAELLAPSLPFMGRTASLHILRSLSLFAIRGELTAYFCIRGPLKVHCCVKCQPINAHQEEEGIEIRL